MLIVLTFCVFMTFSMLIYVMKMTEKCENSTDELCIHVRKNPVFKATYVLYKSRDNSTTMANQIIKPSLLPPVEQSEKYSSGKSFPNASTTAKRKAFHFLISTEISKPTVRTIEKERKTFKNTNNETFDHVDVITSKIERERNHKVDKVLVNSKDDSFNNNFPWKNSNSSYSVYEKRRKNLQRVCDKFFDLKRFQKMKKVNLNHLLVDEKHKILYCYVPKVACTNWKRIFLILTGKAKNISEVLNLPASQVHAKNLFKSLQNYSVSEVLKVTKNYTKFIFVRHPFERLLSAYRNKLEQHYDSSKYFQARFGKYIIKNFRKNPTNVSLAKGDDVTFVEFVNYIVSSDPSFYNEHWQRVTDLCHPCLIKYDFIGKYDTLTEDSNFLLKHFQTNFDFPLLTKPSTTLSNLKKYYNTLDKNAIYKLYKIYEMDFRLFGYDLFNTTDWFGQSQPPVR